MQPSNIAVAVSGWNELAMYPVYFSTRPPVPKKRPGMLSFPVPRSLALPTTGAATSERDVEGNTLMWIHQTRLRKVHSHPGGDIKKPNNTGIPPTTVAQAYVCDAASVAGL
jgi:hypothetical protein